MLIECIKMLFANDWDNFFSFFSTLCSGNWTCDEDSIKTAIVAILFIGSAFCWGHSLEEKDEIKKNTMGLLAPTLMLIGLIVDNISIIIGIVVGIGTALYSYYRVRCGPKHFSRKTIIAILFVMLVVFVIVCINTAMASY